jgi:hypothetical protein
LPVASSVYLSPSSNRSSSNINHEETHRGARETIWREQQPSCLQKSEA